MPNLPQFQIDAFTKHPCLGNPAAVVPLRRWLADELMQSIALENNLSETAFFVPTPDGGESGKADFHLRWFTPTVEVALCGHATLATAHALFTEIGFEKDTIVFDSKSGPLTVRRLAPNETDEAAGAGGALIELDFPAQPLKRVEVTPAICAALGDAPDEVYESMDLICVYDNKRRVHELRPDMAKVAALTHVRAVGVTAPAASHDFVARLFAPQSGVNEDPVTGSLYTMLGPYWAKRLGKHRLTAHQVSHRPGEVMVRVDEAAPGRVFIAGHAVTTIRGELVLPYDPADKFAPDWEDEKKFMVFTKRAGEAD